MLVANAAALTLAVALYVFITAITEFIQASERRLRLRCLNVCRRTRAGAVFRDGLLASRLAATAVASLGANNVLIAGSLLTGAVGAFFGIAHNALWQAFVAMGILGLAFGFSFAAIPGMVTRAVPGRETGSALGLHQVIRAVGFSIGSALNASILAANIVDSSVLPTEQGYVLALGVGSAVAVAAALVTLVFGRGSMLPVRTTRLIRLTGERTSPGRNALSPRRCGTSRARQRKTQFFHDRVEFGARARSPENISVGPHHHGLDPEPIQPVAYLFRVVFDHTDAERINERLGCRGCLRKTCGIAYDCKSVTNHIVKQLSVCELGLGTQESGVGVSVVHPNSGTKPRAQRLCFHHWDFPVARSLRLHRLDSVRHLCRGRDICLNVRLTFGLVGIQELGGRFALKHPPELPGKVDCVTNARAHTLAEVRGHRVGRVTGEECAPDLPRLGRSRPPLVYA